MLLGRHASLLSLLACTRTSERVSQNRQIRAVGTERLTPQPSSLFVCLINSVWNLGGVGGTRLCLGCYGTCSVNCSATAVEAWNFQTAPKVVYRYSHFLHMELLSIQSGRSNNIPQLYIAEPP